MVECGDGTLYTGVTTDIDRRLSEHNGYREDVGAKFSNKGAVYTASRRPVRLVYFEMFPNRSSACAEESRIKKLSRSEKVLLMQNFTKNNI